MRPAVILIAIASLGCGGGSAPSASTPPSPGGDASGARVLFIGNSLTEFNGLPIMVRTLARQAGTPISVEAVTFGGFSLEDHWNETSARRAIGRGGWRYVVLQQGPSSLPESRENLLEWTGRFGDIIRQAGARPALYSVWPDVTRTAFFDDVSESYRQAAARVDGLLLPAGEAWRSAWRRQPRLELYASDDFHPSARGSYLAALVICAQVLGRSPVGLGSPLARQDGVMPAFTPSPAEIALLEEAAVEAIRDHGRP
jgi:hypothetical protein